MQRFIVGLEPVKRRERQNEGLVEGYRLRSEGTAPAGVEQDLKRAVARCRPVNAELLPALGDVSVTVCSYHLPDAASSTWTVFMDRSASAMGFTLTWSPPIETTMPLVPKVGNVQHLAHLVDAARRNPDHGGVGQLLRGEVEREKAADGTPGV